LTLKSSLMEIHINVKFDSTGSEPGRAAAFLRSR
jgi:hypothetical protein